MRVDEPMKWPVRSREVLGSGRVTTFVEETVATPSGEEITRQFITHPGAVAVVAWEESTDEIAVLRQYRHPVGLELVEIPAGLLDVDGEAWVLSAQRELAEEIELAADRWDVLVDILTTPGSSEESLRIYLARDVRTAARPEGFVLEGEEAHMTWSWVPRQHLVDEILAGRCQSPSLVAGVLAFETARLSGRLEDLRPADAAWLARQE
ncbi:NUDIX domain-containing protein [Tessaracoccus sp. ZS01]|uniref:NUDIX domain-containing protein n=1 Tax=Tessaracoccus sp. ZS01 TaxID=1906324 RepID=UPI00096F4FD6|nr:NUDIX hydrolase [Tessaracoccus sp. ZS01]MCG6568359.1 NUDIX hydrolase [Tessaracoccus sp. ZS01]OMG53325.1 ADP-ribose pyrophosphatase [Tessaracoccus sp. ZS01]